MRESSSKIQVQKLYCGSYHLLVLCGFSVFNLWIKTIILQSMKDIIQWLKTDQPTDKGDNVKQLQETMLLGICCELWMQEKSATFQRKVAQEVRNYCVLVPTPMNTPKTRFSDNTPCEVFACHMSLHLRDHSGDRGWGESQGRLIWECQADLLCQQQTACWYNQLMK